jgi:hypothetical protein
MERVGSCVKGVCSASAAMAGMNATVTAAPVVDGVRRHDHRHDHGGVDFGSGDEDATSRLTLTRS